MCEPSRWKATLLYGNLKTIHICYSSVNPPLGGQLFYTATLKYHTFSNI